MNIVTWNIQGIRQNADIIEKNFTKLNLDTKTNEKGTGITNIGEYIHICTGVPEEKRAARGVTLHIKKSLKTQ